MRFNARRTSLVAVAALASSFVAAGCGGGGDSAEDANEVTIWSSMDPPVQAGLEKTLTAQAEEAGYTIDWQKVENINQLIMTKLQANDLPDIAFIPQPGVVADVVERGAGEPLDDVARHGRARGDDDARHARGRHHRRPALRPADLDERQEPGLLQQEGLRGGGLRGADEPSTSSTRSPSRSRPTAAPRGAWASSPAAGDRLAGHRLVRGPGDALRRRGRLQLVGHPRDAVRLRPGARGRRGVRGAHVHRGQRARRPQGDHQHQLRHRGQPDVRRRARLLALQAGLASSPASSRRTSWPTSTPTSASSASRRPRPVARTPCSAVATWR